MRYNTIKKEHDFMAQMRMKSVERAISDQLLKQRHKIFAKKISKLIEEIKR